MRGIARGKRRPVRLSSSSAWLSSSTSWTHARRRPRGVDGRVGAVVGAGQRQRRVREGPELEVVVRVGALVERGQHLLQRQRRVDAAQPERRHAAQRHRGHDPERAEPDPRGAQQVAVVARERAPLARAVDELERLDLGAEVLQPRAGAVRAGGERARQRLGVDVAEVGHRQAELVQPAAERGERDARLGLDEAGRAIGVEDPVEPAEVDERPVGRHARRERVPRARGPHRPARGRRAPDRPGHLARGLRALDRDGHARVGAGPVAPHGADATAYLSAHDRTGAAARPRRALGRPSCRVARAASRRDPPDRARPADRAVARDPLARGGLHRAAGRAEVDRGHRRAAVADAAGVAARAQQEPVLGRLRAHVLAVGAGGLADRADRDRHLRGGRLGSRRPGAARGDRGAGRGDLEAAAAGGRRVVRDQPLAPDGRRGPPAARRRGRRRLPAHGGGDPPRRRREPPGSRRVRAADPGARRAGRRERLRAVRADPGRRRPR